MVELVIGEDCSRDGTRRIVEAYARKYPDVIRALLLKKNVGTARNYEAGVAGLSRKIYCLAGWGRLLAVPAKNCRSRWP